MKKNRAFIAIDIGVARLRYASNHLTNFVIISRSCDKGGFPSDVSMDLFDYRTSHPSQQY